LLAPLVAAAQFTPYAARTQFLPSAPGMSPTGLLGYVNPAVLGRLASPESAVAWSTQRAGAGVVNDWGMYSALPNIGFGVVRRHGGSGVDFREYRLGLGGGDGASSLGLAYGWSSGEGAPDPVFVAGVILQPRRAWSLGATFTSNLDGDARELAGDLGWRPFDSPRLSLFAEGARGWDTGDDSYWNAGADVRLWPGFHLTGSYLDGGTVSLGVRVEFGAAGLWTQRHRDRHRGGSGEDRTRSLHLVRLGPHRGDVSAPLRRQRRTFLQLDLHGTVRHRVYPMFDDGRSLLRLLQTLRRVERDPALAGVAINLSGLRIDAAMSWELRTQLQALRDAGRTVIVYIDRADLRRYHLASVADVIVLDPMGLIVLQGVAAGQIYLRGALDKLGIGSQEWRYHEYKSAFESVNRTGMSDRDREQWQALLEDDYGRARDDITASRGLAETAFDSLVNHVTALLPAEALAAGLVDTVGRWEAVERIVVQRGGTGELLQESGLQYAPVEEWGAPPTVAVVYALGVCAMDSGIRARTLSVELRELAEDAGVDAVVLRVDSPGGDVLASDLVADAVAACRARKPIVVSQARLAASGGYWISMEGDAIVATPATITGSIGVIGGWLYNQGFRERLGLTVDHVQIGDHADLGLGLPLPLLGTPLPERALTDEEVRRTDRVLASLYDDFVARVAAARQRTPEQIDAAARGRIWTGTAAVEQGLVDTLGGLQTAIQLARDRAGIATDRQVRIVERPRLGWFSFRDWPGLVMAGGPLRAPVPQPAWISWLRFRLEHNGQPMVLLPEPLLDQFVPWSGDRP
jgi:protease-4